MRYAIAILVTCLSFALVLLPMREIAAGCLRPAS